MREKPLVSVVMATRNHAQFLWKAIESVLQQSLQDFELIIVNDGATDNTADIITQFQKKDGRIRYLDNGKQLGVPKSVRRALEGAQGKYIARVDSDDAWIGKDKLKKQIEFLEANPKYVAVGGGMVVVDSNGKERYRYLKPQKDTEIRKSALLTNPIANSTSVCRKDAFIKSGFIDEQWNFNEDWDFWLKIGLLGKLYNFPEYFSYYTLTGSNKSAVYLRSHTWAALRIILKYRKHYPNFKKGFLLNILQFAYSLLPFFLRKQLHSNLSRIKKSIAGS